MIVVSAVLVLSCRQIGRHTDAQTDRQTDADKRFTPATEVCMSNDAFVSICRCVRHHASNHGRVLCIEDRYSAFDVMQLRSFSEVDASE